MRRPAVVSAPAMFGRLPDQRDYVRWRVGAEEGRIWQDWLNRQTWVGSGRHIVLPEGQTTDEERDGWMHLSPRGEHDMPAPEHHPLPWSFVMSPGFLPMGGTTDWLTGVLMASRDGVGRPWPLVIYQRCGREWLDESLQETQGWLYWLAVLAGEAGGAAYHAGHDAARAADGAGGPAMGDVAAGAVVGAVAAWVTTYIAAQPGTDRAAG